MILFLLLGFVLLIIFIIALYAIIVLKTPPIVPKIDLLQYIPVQSSEKLLRIGKNWLNNNKWGLYEMYIEGSPFERGVINGRLAEKLIYTQEKIFITEIKKIVTNKLYLGFLKIIVAWINRNLKYSVGKEYDLEIYGISLSASKDFKMIGTNYMRMLNYHAAHDIGHTLQYMNFAGCTSFATLGKKSSDGKIIHARNFDFYVGDEFCKEKIITFYAPEKGNKFVMITWGALIGTVSGMNMKGIAITLNAAKSKLPLKTATPVTILIREMLQYASTIEEVIEIAQKRKISVSESFMISSGMENRVVIIEKTPYNTEIFNPETEQIICTNHFQSEELKNDLLNQKQIAESSSLYRYRRVEELLERNPTVSVKTAVDILRDRYGLGDKHIGNGNEMTINQLLAHHSIIFKPGELKMWVSAGDFTLGEYICYDLSEVFTKAESVDDDCKIVSENEVINCDNFLNDGGFEDFERFKVIKNELSACKKKISISQSKIDEMIALNSDYFLSYSIAGNYFLKKQLYQKASESYKIALQKEIPTLKERDEIRKNLNFCEKKLTQQKIDD